MVWRFKSSPRHQVLEATRGMNTHPDRGCARVSDAGAMDNALLCAALGLGQKVVRGIRNSLNLHSF